MGAVSPPRQFVASADPAQDLDADASELVQLAGVLAIENRAGPAEYIVGATIDGALVAIGADERVELSPTLQAALAHHEVARRVAHATILAEELHLLRVELMEEAPDAPGLNDPVYLYGTLTGPFPATDETRSVRGQLTVTRADVLAGFRLGAAFPFHSKRTDTASFRCFFGVLPGDRAEVIASGRGVVLALPLLAEDGLELSGNELFVAQMLYDLLDALQEELKLGKATTPFARAIVPVPSRPAFVRELEANGFTIEGDTATREKGDAGLVSRLFGGRERVTIPAQATIDDLLGLAELALRELGQPSPQARALAELVDPQPGARNAALARFSSVARAKRAAHVRAQKRELAAPPVFEVTRARPPDEGVAKRATRAEWIGDFVDQHRAPDRPPPRLSSPTRAAAPPRPARPPSAPRSPAERGEPEQSRPDWMKDFE